MLYILALVAYPFLLALWFSVSDASVGKPNDLMQGKTLGFHGGDQRRTFEKMQDTVKEEMNKVFNPEFLNRLDDVIVQNPLSKEHIAQIVAILLREVQRRLGDEVKLTPAATEFLVEHGYDQITARVR